MCKNSVRSQRTEYLQRILMHYRSFSVAWVYNDIVSWCLLSVSFWENSLWSFQSLQPWEDIPGTGRAFVWWFSHIVVSFELKLLNFNENIKHNVYTYVEPFCVEIICTFVKTGHTMVFRGNSRVLRVGCNSNQLFSLPDRLILMLWGRPCIAMLRDGCISNHPSLQTILLNTRWWLL